MPWQGIGQWVESKFFVFTKGRFHQRVDGLDEHMRQLQQGAEIRPWHRNLRKWGRLLAG